MAKKIIELSDPKLRNLLSNQINNALGYLGGHLSQSRRKSLAVKWLIKYAQSRNEKTMSEKLAGEIMAASKEEGGAFKKKEDTHRMAEANKAFSHFRF